MWIIVRISTEWIKVRISALCILPAPLHSPPIRAYIVWCKRKQALEPGLGAHTAPPKLEALSFLQSAYWIPTWYVGFLHPSPPTTGRISTVRIKLRTHDHAPWLALGPSPLFFLPTATSGRISTLWIERKISTEWIGVRILALRAVPTHLQTYNCTDLHWVDSGQDLH